MQTQAGATAFQSKENTPKASIRAALLCTLGLTAATVSLVHAGNADGASYSFDIAHQPLPQALRNYAQIAGQEIIFTEDLFSGTKSISLKGSYTAQEALNELLRGTGLVYERSPSGAIMIKRAGAAATWDGTQSDASIRLAQDGSSAKDSESSNDSLEEIVVTAQKREERLQDVPASIAVLTEVTLERRSVVSLNDFIQYVPGVALFEFGPGINALTVRGIGATIADQQTVGSYLGEIPITSPGLFNSPDIKLVDIERIEVLRGPQGTLFGSSSLGGTLRYIPNLPKLNEFEGKLDVGYSATSRNGGTNSEVNATLNIPLAQDKLALRVTGYYYDNSGYIDYIGDSVPDRAALAAATGASLIEGDDGGASEYAGGRIALLWKSTDALSATFTYMNQQLDQDGFSEENRSLGPYQDFPLSFGDRTPGGRELRFADTEISNLTLSLDLDKWAFVSSSSYLEISGGDVRDVSRDLPVPIGIVEGASAGVTTHELRASSKFEGPLNFLAGVYYERQKTSSYQQVPWLGADEFCCSGFGTDPGDLLASRARASLEQKALFSELYYSPTEKIKLTLGGRYFDYDRASRNAASGFFAGAPGGTVFSNAAGSKDGTNFKTSLSYAPSGNHMLYLQWAQGFRLGAAYDESGASDPPAVQCDKNNDGILDGTNASIHLKSLDPDTVDSWELGSKSAFMDRRLQLNAAIYRIVWEKMPADAVSPCGFGVKVNSAEARSQGVEVEGSFGITRQLQATFGFSVIDAELTKNATALSAEKGDPLLNTADFQAALGLQYEFDAFGRDSFVRADYSHVSGYYANFQESGSEFGDYGKVDARFGIQLGNYQVALFGTNLTGADALVTGDPFGRIWRLRPRTVGLEAHYRF